MIAMSEKTYDQITSNHTFVLKNSTFTALEEARLKYFAWWQDNSTKPEKKLKIPPWDDFFFTLVTLFEKSPFTRPRLVDNQTMLMRLKNDEHPKGENAKNG